MAIDNYWEYDYESAPDQGGSPVGDPPPNPYVPGGTAPSGPPYTAANPPPAPPDGMEYILNPTTGEFELRPRATNPTTVTDPYKDRNNRPGNPPAGYTYEWDEGSGRWYLKASAPAGGGDPGTTTTGGETGGIDAGGEPTAFDWPSYTAPAYQSAGPFTPRRDTFSYQPFSHPDFAAPTIEQARQNPGYQFAAQEGVSRLENSAAGRGVLRTGGTLKDIIGWGNKFADQNYNQVFDRELTTYGTNRANKFDAYRTNLDTEWNKFNSEYGIDRDVYDRLASDTQAGNNYRFSASQAEFAPKFDAAKMSFNDIYNRWRAKLDAATAIATGGPQ